MTAGVEEVRTIMGTPEDVAPMAPEDHPGPRPDTAAPGAPPPDGTGAAPPEKAAAGLPLNDVGNGRRFAAYFGQDVISVPRVGWFVWTGQVWAKDDDELAVRRLGQKVSARIVAEAAHVELSAAQRAGIAEARATIAELGALATAGSLDREKVRAAIAATDLDTVYGKVTFLDNGQIKGNSVVLQIIDGKIYQVYPSMGTTPVNPVPPWNKR